MFSYILVVSRGYILLISIYSMLDAGKLHIIASLQFYFKTTSRGEKNGGFLLNCTKIQLTVLCLKSLQLPMWVDFKIESVLQARRKKIKLYIHLEEERGNC